MSTFATIDQILIGPTEVDSGAGSGFLFLQEGVLYATFKQINGSG